MADDFVHRYGRAFSALEGNALVSNFLMLITKIEAAVAAHPELTHDPCGDDVIADPELKFTRSAWQATCLCRNLVSRDGTTGRRLPGSQRASELRGSGPTPEAAVEELIELLPYWADGLRKDDEKNRIATQFDQMMHVLFEGRIPSPLHRLTAAAEVIAATREPWWRWTCFFAIAVAAQQSGSKPQ